jgi:hypothetical protein
LQDKIDGVIVSMDNELAAGDIADFIRNKEKQNILIKNMKNKNYGNEIEIEKIYKLI